MQEPTGEGTRDIGWLRALASAIVILAVGFSVLVIGTDYALSELTGLNRHGRVAVATSIFFVGFFALAWALRWLQHRRMI